MRHAIRHKKIYASPPAPASPEATAPPSEPITGKYWAEGPTILRLGGQWVVYFDKYTEHKYGAVVSPDLKDWTDISEQVEVPKGMRHGTIFTVTTKELEKLRENTRK